MALIIAAAPSADALIAEAISARKAGDLERSLAALTGAYALRPLPVLLNNMGRLLEDLGRYDEAAAIYRRVVADAAADDALVRLDQARLIALEPKMAKAWLRIGVDTTPIFVEGRRVFEARELGFDGQSVVMHGAATGERVVRFVALTRGRAYVATPTDLAPRADDGLLIMPAQLKELTIDGHLIRTDGADRLRLASGAHHVEARLDDNSAIRRTIVITAGQRHELDPLFAVTAVVERLPAAASPWPYVCAGIGATSAGVGIGLLVDAANRRGQVTGATTDPNGVITSVTLARAVQLEATADRNATAGAVALTVGAAAVLTGVLLWVFDGG